MSSLARPWDRDSRRRSWKARFDLEHLEGRAMLSGVGAGLSGSPPTPPPRVPTVITLGSVADSAETGQSIALVATVSAAGTARQIKKAQSETISGTIEFVTESPRPTILARVPINGTGQSSLPLLSEIQSTFGVGNQPGTSSAQNSAALWTKAPRKLGPHPIEARFLPANAAFRASKSAPKIVTVAPRTKGAPTVTSLQAPESVVEMGAVLPLNVTVGNPDSSLAGGIVRLTTVSPHPVVLGRISVGTFNRPISLETDKLKEAGTYQIQAVYRPANGRFAGSASAPVSVTVTPMTATSFRVTPVVSHGGLGEPLSFSVTALDAQWQPLTDYTGTVVFSSPTDSWSLLTPAAYDRLGIAEPSPDSPGLATFSPSSYTFTKADRGAHTFVGAVAFGKGGAETLQVSQADDPEVSGKTTFAIA